MKLKSIRLLLLSTAVVLLTACGGGPYLTGTEAEELVRAHMRERYIPKPEYRACEPGEGVAGPYNVFGYLEPAIWPNLHRDIDFGRELAMRNIAGGADPEILLKIPVNREQVIEEKRSWWKEYWETLGPYKPPTMTHKYDDSDNTWLVSVLFGPTRSRETRYGLEDKGQLYDVYASWKVDDKIFTVVPQSGTALGECY